MAYSGVQPAPVARYSSTTSRGASPAGGSQVTACPMPDSFAMT